METSPLSSKGQLVIPKDLRRSAQLQPGDRRAVSYVEGEIRLRRLPPVQLPRSMRWPVAWRSRIASA